MGAGLAGSRGVQGGLGGVNQVPRLQGAFPQEMQPLIDDFNGDHFHIYDNVNSAKYDYVIDVNN